jgi:hypothetical protein
VPYVPGWDCHGLPIEHKIQQELGPKMREMSVVDVRQKCFDYAAKYAKLQSEQFQRLGVLGDWAHPYWTMAPAYEANTLEVFARFVENGLVYKKLKPVPWSIANQTALADAELEYKDVDDTSIFVEFPMGDAAAARRLFKLADPAHPMYLLVWTTTPWTLPANLAVAVNPDVEYVAVTYRRDGVTKVGVVAEKLRRALAHQVRQVRGDDGGRVDDGVAQRLGMRALAGQDPGRVQPEGRILARQPVDRAEHASRVERQFAVRMQVAVSSPWTAATSASRGFPPRSRRSSRSTTSWWSAGASSSPPKRERSSCTTERTVRSCSSARRRCASSRFVGCARRAGKLGSSSSAAAVQCST